MTTINEVKRSPFHIRVLEDGFQSFIEFDNAYDTLVKCKALVMQAIAGRSTIDSFIAVIGDDWYSWEPADHNQLKGFTGTRDLNVFKSWPTLQTASV